MNFQKFIKIRINYFVPNVEIISRIGVMSAKRLFMKLWG